MENAWLVRPSPHGINRMAEFLEKNIIAVGWPHIGNLQGCTREKLKDILSQEPYNLKSLALGNAYATIDIFVNQMNIGDLVLVADGDEIHFCIVESAYFLDSTVDNDTDGYPHQRKVKWISNTSRNVLPKDLRYSLKVHRTTANLSHHNSTIESIAYNKYIPESTNEEESLVDVEYPLRPDLKISLRVPRDITQVEAERLGNFIKTLYFK